MAKAKTGESICLPMYVKNKLERVMEVNYGSLHEEHGQSEVCGLHPLQAYPKRLPRIRW